MRVRVINEVPKDIDFYIGSYASNGVNIYMRAKKANLDIGLYGKMR